MKKTTKTRICRSCTHPLARSHSLCPLTCCLCNEWIRVLGCESKPQSTESAPKSGWGSAHSDERLAGGGCKNDSWRRLSASAVCCYAWPWLPRVCWGVLINTSLGEKRSGRKFSQLTKGRTEWTSEEVRFIYYMPCFSVHLCNNEPEWSLIYLCIEKMCIEKMKMPEIR